MAERAMIHVIVFDPTTGIGKYSTKVSADANTSGLGSLVRQVTPARARNPSAWRVVGDVVKAYNAPVNRDRLKQAARQLLYRKAERLRGKNLKLATGQIMTYMEKEKEARDFVLDGSPTLSNYPFLGAEFGADLADLTAGATSVIARANFTRLKAAQIEGVRTRTNRLIDVATSKTQIRTILNAVVWPDTGN